MKTTLSEPLLAGTLLEDEIRLETRAIEEGVIRYRDLVNMAIRRGDGAGLKPAERLLAHWFEVVSHLIQTELDDFRAGRPGVGRTIAGPVLSCLPAQSLAVIVMHTCTSACMDPSRTEENRIVRLASSVGSAVYAEIHARMARRIKVTIRHRNGRDREYGLQSLMLSRFRRATPARVNWYAKKHLADPLVSIVSRTQAGATLIRCLIEGASDRDYSEAFSPAFEREFVRRKGKTHGVLRLSARAMSLINEGHERRQYLRPRYLPMIVPPYRWSETAQGGYVHIRTPLLSKPTQEQKIALAQADLSGVYDAIDALGGVAWRIDAWLLGVVRRLADSGGGVAGIPCASDAELPPQPATADPIAIRAWKAEREKIHGVNARRRADRCAFHQTMSVADLMLDRERVYFPHMLDFRGRAFAIPPHLNFQGDDLRRSLMRFAEARAPGPNGARWLAINAANAWKRGGLDKLPYPERIEWVMDHLENMRRCGRDPLSDEWWMGAKKPMRFLSLCRAMVDPEAAAHVWTEIDGTCNGLQHYSAMARDARGAEAVNLVASSRPRSVYKDVAEAVTPRVRRDAASGDPNAIEVLPLLATEAVEIIKQTVMTMVYGVTEVGAHEQIRDQLHERAPEGRDLFEASRYLSRIVLDSMGDVCRGARSIMDWIRACAKVHTDHDQVVSWTSPMGLPVVQPYRNRSAMEVKTCLQSIDLVRLDKPASPKAGKQRDAAAPCVVHSVDASHLAAVAVRCRERKISFGSRYDCFATHAADMDALARIVPEEFVRLHRRPILEDLHREWCANIPEADFPDPPEPGDFDLDQVMDSTYAFS